MPTAFDVTTYPLSADTKAPRGATIARDILDDGSPRIRVLGGEFATVELFFNPMDSVKAQSFEAYISANYATEFDITIRGTTYRGYIWSDLSDDASKGSNAVMYQLDFRGKVV